MHIYTNLKIFHYKDNLDALPADVEEIKAPIHIRIKPTNVCNHNCSYCAYRNDDLQLGQDMKIKDKIPESKMDEIVDDCIEMGVKAVTFSGGGEPFCYPHLSKTALRLAEGGVKIASLTNGGRLKGDAAEVFAQHGTWIRISMDGWDGPSYSNFRGVNEDEFGNVLNNIENFKKLGSKCFLGVSYIINKDNADHVYEMAKRLKDIGVDSVKFAPCIVSNKGSENNKYHAPIFDLVKEQTKKACSDLADKKFNIFDSYHRLAEKFEKKYSWCPYIQILPVIGADLNVYSCHDKAYNLDNGSLGSIKDTRFKDFWMNNKSKFFKIDPRRDCNHHCVCNSHNMLIHEYLDVNMDHLPFV